ncbi:Wall-associated receptor kinase-like 8 [Bienertia sinuspersici]
MGQTQTKYNEKIKNEKRPKFKSKEEYFVKNGGILLEKQIALSQGQHKGAGQLRVYSSKDILNATDYYNPDLIVGSNAHSTIYKGTLEDRIVAVKAPPQLEQDPELIGFILTEASTIMVMNHDNMVKLHGICLETCTPILVYEFLLSGGLFQRLHGDVGSSNHITWAQRLRVASDAAYALSYMHNALSKPVVHRDVNSLAILLDCSFGAKLANFGHSVSITPGEKPQQWPVEGTPGYIDPEYIETQEVTDKCDVYSFGVFMLELLTRKQPCMMARCGTDLVDVFVSAVEKDCMMEIIDHEVLEQAGRDEIQCVARLALALSFGTYKVKTRSEEEIVYARHTSLEFRKIDVEERGAQQKTTNRQILFFEGVKFRLKTRKIIKILMGQAQTKYYKKIKNVKRSKFESKEEFFVKNGGILLEKQIALSQGQHKGTGQLKVYSSKDIENATDYYNPDLITGRVAHATVYKATLEGRIVAVKVASQLEPNPELIDLFLTEASTIMVMNHDNMVKLYGVCLETFIPMLVYEFFPNKDLFEFLHGDIGSCKRLNWDDCLRVASDVGYALCYMHNALSKPVVHRGLNSSSVLLDCSYGAKLVDFEHAVSINPMEKHQQWPVEGIPGYIDPEYIETQEVTDKCDVYSFGVFMLELLTRKQPCMMARCGTDLVDVFLSAVEKDCIMEIIDNEVLEQAGRDEIQSFARLALACVAKIGVERPTMIDVVSVLWNIRGRDKK